MSRCLHRNCGWERERRWRRPWEGPAVVQSTPGPRWWVTGAWERRWRPCRGRGGPISKGICTGPRGPSTSAVAAAPPDWRPLRCRSTAALTGRCSLAVTGTMLRGRGRPVLWCRHPGRRYRSTGRRICLRAVRPVWVSFRPWPGFLGRIGCWRLQFLLASWLPYFIKKTNLF